MKKQVDFDAKIKYKLSNKFVLNKIFKFGIELKVVGNQSRQHLSFDFLI